MCTTKECGTTGKLCNTHSMKYNHVHCRSNLINSQAKSTLMEHGCQKNQCRHFSGGTQIHARTNTCRLYNRCLLPLNQKGSTPKNTDGKLRTNRNTNVHNARNCCTPKPWTSIMCYHCQKGERIQLLTAKHCVQTAMLKKVEECSVNILHSKKCVEFL